MDIVSLRASADKPDSLSAVRAGATAELQYPVGSIFLLNDSAHNVEVWAEPSRTTGGRLITVIHLGKASSARSRKAKAEESTAEEPPADDPPAGESSSEGEPPADGEPSEGSPPAE